jgi:ADP-ribose pyrophosphatase YjhB (NUDIX family)
MKSTELIARIIIKRGDKVLLCKNKEQGHYFLPGGHVEYGDTLVKTIYKEMNEELGLDQELITGVAYKSYLEEMYGGKDGKNRHELNMIFTANIPEDINIVSQEDHIDFEWIDKKDIKNIKLLPEKIASMLFR